MQAANQDLFARIESGEISREAVDIENTEQDDDEDDGDDESEDEEDDEDDEDEDEQRQHSKPEKRLIEMNLDLGVFDVLSEAPKGDAIAIHIPTLGTSSSPLSSTVWMPGLAAPEASTAAHDSNVPSSRSKVAKTLIEEMPQTGLE
ncbi:hypothetical protein BC831DRAFT_261699 [Entophlyctis helioformis]|nr:hypothetical protein BC831DRAFT_261699 [Entophlyctis helioformis]